MALKALFEDSSNWKNFYQGDFITRKQKFDKDISGGGFSGQPFIKRAIPSGPGRPIGEYYDLSTQALSLDFPVRGGSYEEIASREDFARIDRFFLYYPQGKAFTDKYQSLLRSNPKIETGREVGDSNTRIFPIGNSGLGNCITEPDFSEYGNAYQLISGLKNKSNVGLKKIEFDDLFKVYSSTLISTEDEETINASFITLGHLFCLVQHICIIKEENNNVSRPCIHIDYHPDNTIARIGIVNASIDPTTCLVEFGGNDTNLATLLSPLDINRDKPYDFQPTDATPNNEKNISTGYTDILSGKINPKFRIGTSISEGGRLFNVLINLDYALKTIEVLKQNSPIRRVAVREYLQAIVDGVDRSLGGLNNFKVTFEDKSQTLRVIDLNYVPEKIDYLTIPPFGKEGIAYDYSYSTKISKELASQVVIASQAQDKGIKDFPDDVLSFNRLNEGVVDALAEKIKKEDEEPVFGPQNDPDFFKNQIAQLRGPQAIFNQLYNIYSLTEEGKINARLSRNLITSYNDRQQKALNQVSFKKGADIGVLMPLQLTITIDGISGILPYSAFLLSDDRLPARYRGRVAFIVFSINHDFEGNKWTTTLRGQTIMKP